MFLLLMFYVLRSLENWVSLIIDEIILFVVYFNVDHFTSIKNTFNVQNLLAFSDYGDNVKSSYTLIGSGLVFCSEHQLKCMTAGWGRLRMLLQLTFK